MQPIDFNSVKNWGKSFLTFSFQFLECLSGFGGTPDPQNSFPVFYTDNDGLLP
jgi:hypothetical protein